MKRYTVRSTFKDAKGRDLFHSKTFDGEAEDARCALTDAHAEMARLGAEDSRVDSISSVVKGPNEEISTTDYLDELGSGMSTNGLIYEVTPQQLERASAPTIDPARDGFAKGGVSESADIFPGGLDGYDHTKELGSGSEGIDAPLDSAPAAGGPVRVGPGWSDPGADPLADIRAGRGLIGKLRLKQPWLAPIEQVTRPHHKTLKDYITKEVFPDSDYLIGAGDLFIADEAHDVPDQVWRKLGKVKEFKIKVDDSARDVIKQSRQPGKTTLRGVTEAYYKSRNMTEAEKRAMTDLYESQGYEVQYATDEEETE